MRRIVGVAFTSALLSSFVHVPAFDPPTKLTGLAAAAEIVRDGQGVAHIRAGNEHDLFFLQGWVHAQDRLFQMDYQRHLASGTLAELLGPDALPTDAQLRTFGLRRAAQVSMPVLSARALAALDAYTDGVNAFTAAAPGLPPEYAALELTRINRWTVLDSIAVVKLVAFGLSFDAVQDIQLTTALGAYQDALGAPRGASLFYADLFRPAPFDPASTVPDASVPSSTLVAADAHDKDEPRGYARRSTAATTALGRNYLDRIKDAEKVQSLFGRARHGSSNEWVIDGEHTASGLPMLANDPHLALGTPSTLYPIHLQAGPFDVVGSSFPGAPFVFLGHNQWISWGATKNPMDVTDVFLERLAPSPLSSVGLGIVHDGAIEPIQAIPQVFSQNKLDGIPDNLSVVPPSAAIPAFTLIVPRRNNGPIIEQLGPEHALSVQYAGFGATREVDTFLALDVAKDLDDFVRGLQFFDVGSQNFAYSDVHGNIAFFTAGKMPLREDLQAGFVSGAPPFLIRDGTHGNEWLTHALAPGETFPYEALPFDEMPHMVNPPAGFFVNSNNDPAGTTLDNDPLNQRRPSGGIYYLNPGYDGFRAGRVMQVIRQALAAGKPSFADMQAIQADTVMIDAQIFTPCILRAFANGQARGAHPLLAALAANLAVAAAASRLAAWDQSTPTGIPEGYDANANGGTSSPSSGEISASVAATIYAVWRGQFIHNTIDAALDPPFAPFSLPKPDGRETLTALRNLLDNFGTGHGVGASGVNFFIVPGVASAADRRDILILRSLLDALTRLAGPPFAMAFGGSTNQDDYRWGKLHRVVFAHALGGPFSVPPAGGAFPHPLGQTLPGIPTDGGFEVIDRSDHDPRADNAAAFMFAGGPAQRFTSEGGQHAASGYPGGTSGTLGTPHSFNLLQLWLANDAFPLWFRHNEVQANAVTTARFVPDRGRRRRTGAGYPF
jgi:penicillin amidase